MPIVISVIFFVIYYIISITGEKLAKEGDKGRREREMQERQANQERFNNTMNTTGGMFMR